MALPNFFNSYFYGRSGKKDFTEDDLPENRFQLFRDVLLVRRGSMVGVNLLYLLIWLPAIAWTILNLLMLFSPPGGSDDIYPLRLAFSYLTILCPLIAITGPFNVGISYVLRNWARDEHSFVLSDFAAALKANWKQGLLLGLGNGLLPLLTFVCVWFYSQMTGSALFYALPLAVSVIAALLWSLISMILPMMIVTYRQSFFCHVRNALLMTIAALPRALLIRLATWALPGLIALVVVLNLPVFSIVAALTVLLYLVFMLAFNKLIHVSFANALCEKYLNPKIHGAATGIGLHPRKEAKNNESEQV